MRAPTRALLGLLVIGALSACGRGAAPAESQAPPPVAEESTSGSEASSPGALPAGDAAPAAVPAAVSTSVAAKASGAAQESAGAADAADTATSKGERTLEKLTQLPAQDQLPAGKWQAGKNYQTIVPAQPTSVGPGRVEVVEMFWYGCGHCYQLDPFLESWKKNKPAYVDFVRVPVTWSPVHKAHARLFYTLQALGKGDELHVKVFDAIHRGGRMLAGNDDAGSLKDQLAWAKDNGISEADFTNAWNSFGVTSALQRADQLMRRYRVEGVPLVVVNGKYSADVGSAGGQSQLLGLINDLAAAEKRR